MLHGAPRRRRARPVADAPVDKLLPRCEDLAKGWLLALLELAPLGDAAAILAAELARDGPRVCDAIVRALADEADLRRLEPDGALEPLVSRAGELAGAEGAEAASRAVDALHGVLWSALRAELRDPDAEQIAELSERLTLVLELVRAAALRRSAGMTVHDVRHARGRGEAGRSGASLGASADADEGDLARAAHGGPAPGPVHDVVWPPPRAREEARRSSAESPRAEPAGREPAEAREPAWREEPASEAPAPALWLREGEAAARAADPLWVGAVEDEIRRSEHSSVPLSLLLVELEEADHVLAIEPPSAARATFGRFAQSVRSAVRRQDILACETESRAWIIARDTSRSGANALAARVATAVRQSEGWRGAPLTVSAGVAVLGEDGGDAPALIGAAEEAKFAAAASGLSVLPGRPGRPGRADDEPEGGGSPMAS